jgi:hypothetical protein
MNLPARWSPRFWKHKLPAAHERSTEFAAAPDAGLKDLQTRLNRWSNLWAHEHDSEVHSEAQQLVAERLTRWMEHCFGQHVQGALRGSDNLISLASSTPIFTAFLGRRATRELSRRVLQDI